MAREESVIFRFVTEGKEKALRDFAEVESAAQRTAAAMGGQAGGGASGPAQRSRGGGGAAPAGALTGFGGQGEQGFASLPPVGPSSAQTSAVRVDPGLVQTIAQVVSQTLREAMTKGAQAAEQAVSAQVQATQRTVAGGMQPMGMPSLQPVAPLMGGNGVSQAGVYNIPVEQIRSDPANLQWRRGARGAGGTTGRLAGIRQFDESQAGTIDVMRDPTNPGGYVVIEGHHRTEALRESVSQGWKPAGATMQATIQPFSSYQEARAFGAMKNILAGQGTPFEIASYIREQYGVGGGKQFLADPRLGRNVPNVQEGAALADLAQPLLDQYERGRLSLSRAVGIGRLGVSPTAQQRIYTDIQKLSSGRGRALSEDEFQVYIRRAANAATTSEAQTDFFGQTGTRTILNERVQVEAGVMGRLRSGRTALSQLGRESLVTAGQQMGILTGEVNTGQARDLAAQASQALEVISRLADDPTTAVSRLMNVGAEQVAGGGNLQEVIANITKQISSPEFLQAAVRGGTGYSPTLAEPGQAGTATGATPTSGGRGAPRTRRGRRSREEIAAEQQQIAEEEGYSNYQEYVSAVEARNRDRARASSQRGPTMVQSPEDAAQVAAQIAAGGRSRQDIEFEQGRARDVAQLSGLSLKERRLLERQGFGPVFTTVLGEGAGGAGGGGGGGAPTLQPGEFEDEDPIDKQRSRTLTREGMQNIRGQDRRAANAAARLRNIEIRINEAIQTIEELGTSTGATPAQQRRIRQGLRAAQSPDLGAQGLFNPATGRFTTSGIGVPVEELESRFTTGLQQVTGRGIQGQQQRAVLAEANAAQRRAASEERERQRATVSLDRQASTAAVAEVRATERQAASDARARQRATVSLDRQAGAAGLKDAIAANVIDTNDQGFEFRSARMRVLQRQIGAHRDELDKLVNEGRGGTDPRVARVSANLQKATETYAEIANEGKQGFGVNQGGFVGALQSASFKAFPFTIGAFAVQSGTAPLGAAAGQFQMAYQQRRAESLEELQARAGLAETQARLGAQGAGVNRGLQTIGTRLLGATEPFAGGAIAAGGAVVGGVISQGLNVAGLVVALKEMTGIVKVATAGLGGFANIVSRVAGMAGSIGVGGAVGGLGLAGAAVAANIAYTGTPYTPASPFVTTDQQSGKLRLVTEQEQIEPFRRAVGLPAPGQTPAQIAAAASADRMAAFRQREGVQFTNFEESQVEEERRQADDPRGYAYQQAQLRQLQARGGFAQFQRGQAVEARQDQRTLERLDLQQRTEIRQINRGFDNQVEDIGMGRARQERGIYIGGERSRRDLAQQQAYALQDIDRGSGRQIAGINLGLQRTERDIAIGAGESREDIQRGLGRSLASIDRQGARSQEGIERSFQRGFQDIVLGQIGGIGGQFVNLGVQRGRATEDLAREQALAREDAQRQAGEAGEDVDTATGRARRRAGQGAVDARQDVGISAGYGREDAQTARDRGETGITQQITDALEDVNQGYKDTMEDLNRTTRRAITEREEIQKIERDQLDKDLKERQALRDQLKTDYLYQLTLVDVANQSLEKQTEIYRKWNEAIETHTKSLNRASDNVKLGAARAWTN